MSIEELNMNKAERLIKQHPILGIAILILIMIEVLKLFCTCMVFTCLLWTLLVKKWQP